jgi:hypothetical protein
LDVWEYLAIRVTFKFQMQTSSFQVPALLTLYDFLKGDKVGNALKEPAADSFFYSNYMTILNYLKPALRECRYVDSICWNFFSCELGEFLNGSAIIVFV